MKILIISHNFPPANSIASLRPYSWAKYWHEEGHDISVLTTKKNAHTSDLTYNLDNFNIIEYKGRGWFESKKNSIKESRANIKKESLLKKVFFKGLSFFTSRGVLIVDTRMPNLHDIGFKDGYEKVKNEEWDLVISTYAPYVSHLIAYKLKKKDLCKFWIADYRDLWTQNHIHKGLFPFTLVEKYLERLINKTADIVTTVSDPLAEQIRGNSSKCSKVYTFENGFDIDDLEGLPKEFFWKNKKCRIIYTGSIYIGKRDPSPLFKAIKEISLTSKKDILDKLEVIFFGSDKGNLDTLIEQYNVQRWVKYGGFLSRNESLQVQRDADVLLFLEYEAPDVKGVLTGKLFEYLFSATPILGIGITKDSASGSVIQQARAGDIVFNDVHEITSYLEKLLVNEKKNYRNINKSYISLFSRKIKALEMLNLVKSNVR